MGYYPVTTFRRPLDAARIEAVQALLRTSDVPVVSNKWELLRDLALGRQAFGLTDRDLSVLEALLSFLPGQALDPAEPLIVWPSNATICERLNHMPCSTMRRHLAALTTSGLIARRDSPNAKRYLRHGKRPADAYGLDLKPLVLRAAEIFSAAEAARNRSLLLRDLREEASLKRRDLIGLLQCPPPALPESLLPVLEKLVEESAKQLRRKPEESALRLLNNQLSEMLTSVQNLQLTEKMSISGAETEQHLQNTNINPYESKPPAVENSAEGPEAESGSDSEELNLTQVLTVCTQVHALSPDPILTWDQLEKAANRLAPMMGLSQSLWTKARLVMGPLRAAATLSAMLERFDQIRNPAAYLQNLCQRASLRQFSCNRMLRALA